MWNLSKLRILLLFFKFRHWSLFTNFSFFFDTPSHFTFFQRKLLQKHVSDQNLKCPPYLYITLLEVIWLEMFSENLIFIKCNKRWKTLLLLCRFSLHWHFFSSETKRVFFLNLQNCWKRKCGEWGYFLRAQFNSQYLSALCVDTRVSSERVNVNLIPKHSPLIRPGSVLFSDILNRDMIDHWLFSDKCLQHTSPQLPL